MDPSEGGKPDPIGRAIAWIVDHVQCEANLDSPLVVIGDPHVVASGPPVTVADLRGEPFARIARPAGDVLAITRHGDSDGPWLWICASSDGPLEKLLLVRDIWLEQADEQPTEPLNAPSGLLVVGPPEDVAAWGPSVALAEDREWESKSGWDYPTPTYVGSITLVRVDEPHACQISVGYTSSGVPYGLSIALPRPDWVPFTLNI